MEFDDNMHVEMFWAKQWLFLAASMVTNTSVPIEGSHENECKIVKKKKKKKKKEYPDTSTSKCFPTSNEPIFDRLDLTHSLTRNNILTPMKLRAYSPPRNEFR